MKKLIALSILIITLAFSYSCMNGTDDLGNRVITIDPFGTQIILVNGNFPGAIFGNLCDEVEIQITANEDLTPDGSTVTVELNSTSIPSSLRGCITGVDNQIINGEAFIEMLVGLFIDPTPSTVDPTDVATVNVSVTVTTPGGDPESDFFSMILNAVRLTPPEDQTITTNPVSNPLSLFLTLDYTTNGIPPGTIVTFEAADPALGMIDPALEMVPVIGTLAEGSVTTEYVTVNGTGGVQTITATVILPDPNSKNPICPSIPEADRTIEVVLIITQDSPDAILEICDNLVDDNFNGLVDCADPQCPDGSGCNVGPMMPGMCALGVCVPNP